MFRDEIIYGIRPVIEAVRSGKEMDRILIQKGLRGELFRELWQLLKDLEIPFQYVPMEKLNKLTTGNHQGVLAFITPVSYQSVEVILPGLYESGRVPLLLVLDHITDVRNFGAIARTAECAGVDAILIPAYGSVRISADAVKTSAGALVKVPVHRSADLKKTLQFLRDSGVKLVAATEKAEKSFFTVDYSVPVALILGSEEAGVSAELLRMADDLVRIPVFGDIESLNVSVAAGIMLYEVLRCRTGSPE